MPAPLNNANATRSWTDAQDAALRLCLFKKMTFSETAEFLNEKFGKQYTRSAIGGRAMRLRLKSCNLPIPRPGVPQVQTNARVAAAMARRRPRKTSTRQLAANMPQFNRDGLTGLRCVEIEPMNVDLIDLAPNGCRWPYGDRPFTFCNHPKLEGLSYCLDHHALSVGYGTHSEQRATWVSDKVA